MNYTELKQREWKQISMPKALIIRSGSEAYQQTIGIPMGTDCAPLVADLFLFSYEFEFKKSLIRTDLSVAAKFSNTCRYIDDLHLTTLIFKHA